MFLDIFQTISVSGKLANYSLQYFEKIINFSNGPKPHLQGKLSKRRMGSTPRHMKLQSFSTILYSLNPSTLRGLSPIKQGNSPLRNKKLNFEYD